MAIGSLRVAPLRRLRTAEPLCTFQPVLGGVGPTSSGLHYLFSRGRIVVQVVRHEALIPRWHVRIHCLAISGMGK